MAKQLSRPMTILQAEDAHRRIVRHLDLNPKYRWRDAPPAAAWLIDQVRPVLYEMYATDQVTEEEILRTLAELGYPVGKHQFWQEMSDSRPKPRGTRRTMGAGRPISATRMDAMIVKVAEAIGVDRLDPRVRLRALELTGGLPIGVASGASLVTELTERLDAMARARWPA